MSSSTITRSVLLCLLIAGAIIPRARSYVTGGSGGDVIGAGGILSKFAGDVRCELVMTVGRTPSTAMPPEWAASSGKLGLPLTLRFSTYDDTKTTKTRDEFFLEESNREALLGEGRRPSPSFVVRPLNEPSFVGVNGQETVRVAPGRFSCLSSPGSEQCAFRFFLDFPDGAAKNDVSLPAKRIYFMTACWNEDEGGICRAKMWKEDIVNALGRINSEIEELDRGYSVDPTKGGDLLKNIRRRWTLSDRRRKLARRIDALEQAYPPDHRLVLAPNNVMFLKEGVIAVKRFKGRNEQYHWVGTFKFKNFSENDKSGSRGPSLPHQNTNMM